MLRYFGISICVIITALLLVNCGDVNHIGYTEEIILPVKPKTAVYRMTKRYYIAMPGDTALFHGTRVCTVFVNGVLDEVRTKKDSVFHRTITHPSKFISLPWIDEKVSVYPREHQFAHSRDLLDESTITRYIQITDTTTEQVAFSYGRLNEDYQKPDAFIIIPHTIIAGDYSWGKKEKELHRWRASSIIHKPEIFKDAYNIRYSNYNIVTTPLALPNTPDMPPYFVNGYNYVNGILYDSYYAIHGEGFEDNQVVVVTGSIYMTTSRFADCGVIDIQQENFFQKRYANGKTEVIKENIYLARSSKAKVFNEDTMFVRLSKELKKYDGQLTFPE